MSRLAQHDPPQLELRRVGSNRLGGGPVDRRGNILAFPVHWSIRSRGSEGLNVARIKHFRG